MQKALLNVNLPPLIRKMVPKTSFEGRMDKISQDIKDRLYKDLEEEKNEEIKEHLIKEISEQIESCLTKMAEVVEIPLG